MRNLSSGKMKIKVQNEDVVKQASSLSLDSELLLERPQVDTDFGWPEILSVNNKPPAYEPEETNGFQFADDSDETDIDEYGQYIEKNHNNVKVSDGTQLMRNDSEHFYFGLDEQDSKNIDLQNRLSNHKQQSSIDEIESTNENQTSTPQGNNTPLSQSSEADGVDAKKFRYASKNDSFEWIGDRRPSEDIDKFYYGMGSNDDIKTDVQSNNAKESSQNKISVIHTTTTNAGSTPFHVRQRGLHIVPDQMSSGVHNNQEQTMPDSSTGSLNVKYEAWEKESHDAYRSEEISYNADAASIPTSDNYDSHYDRGGSNLDMSLLALEPLELPDDDSFYDDNDDELQKNTLKVNLGSPVTTLEREPKKSLKMIRSSDFVVTDKLTKIEDDGNNNVPCDFVCK
jgi:hypothetical protein